MATQYCLTNINARERVYGYRCEVVLTCFVHSRQRELVLAFSIVDVAESGTVTCVIRDAISAHALAEQVMHKGKYLAAPTRSVQEGRTHDGASRPRSEREEMVIAQPTWPPYRPA